MPWRQIRRAHLVVVAALLFALLDLPARVLSGEPSGPRAQTDPGSVAPIVNPKLYQDMKWRNVGPQRGGRVTAIAGVRTKPCTFYMGATGGGVWKTESCGNDWTPISDGQIATGSIGAIDVSDSDPDVVYVGTGSAAIRSNVIIGRGMYKSTDAGKTWTFVGLRDAGQIGSAVVHPTNPDIVWIAALGSPFGPNEDRGIFKTIDGGRTWKKTLFVNNETGGRVVAINWSNPNEVYA
ncbi:MAG: WD40/YVTN/BNR-like repeat-containing protein, partial [Vicinamibacteraceae bacterium]